MLKVIKLFIVCFLSLSLTASKTLSKQNIFDMVKNLADLSFILTAK